MKLVDNPIKGNEFEEFVGWLDRTNFITRADDIYRKKTVYPIQQQESIIRFVINSGLFYAIQPAEDPALNATPLAVLP